MEPKGTLLYKRPRELVNIETEDDAPPVWYWRDPPPTPTLDAIERLVQKKKRELYEQTRKESWQYLKSKKAFANPAHKGYGGPEDPWPFNSRRALNDARYRQGVKNAMRADWTAQNWKFEAKKLMDRVDAQLAVIELEEIKDLIF